MTCKIRGPYLPVGDTDFECVTHEVLCELRDPSRAGVHNIRKDEVYCPAGEFLRENGPMNDDQTPDLHDCGYPEGSFACKIRHVHLNTGWAKAAND